MTFTYQPRPTTAEIERSLSVVGFLWMLQLPPPVNHPPQSNIHARFRRFWASFGRCYYHHLFPPPQLPESSIRARFQRLLAFSGRCHYHPHQLAPTTSESWVFGVVGLIWLPRPPPPPTNHPTTPENERLRLFFSGCGLSLVAAATMTPITPKIERACLFSAVVGFLWPPPNPPLPKSNIRARFGSCGLSLATHIYHNRSPTLNSKSSA